MRKKASADNICADLDIRPYDRLGLEIVPLRLSELYKSKNTKSTREEDERNYY